jgi:hypothetical protein
MALKYSKWSKIYQHFPIKGPPNFTKIGIFGLKINHLATLFTIQAFVFLPSLSSSSHCLFVNRFTCKDLMATSCWSRTTLGFFPESLSLFSVLISKSFFSLSLLFLSHFFSFLCEFFTCLSFRQFVDSAPTLFLLQHERDSWRGGGGNR